MDRFELVEKLVKSTGVGYEDAKIALESSGWDLLDAAVWLEKNGKIEAKTNSFSTDPEQQEQTRQRQQQEQQQRSEAPRGSARADGERGGLLRSIFSKIRGILIDNELVICKQSGEIFLEIPVWLAVILLVVAFWPTLIVLVLVLLLGFRFRLHGPDLGSETVNRVLNHAENTAANFIIRLKNQIFDSGRNSGSSRSDDVIDYEDHNRKE